MKLGFLKIKNLLRFFIHLCSSHSSVANNSFFLVLSVVLSGCATAPAPNHLSPEEAQTQSLLSQAATRFTAPDAPKALTLLDDAQAEWRSDKSIRVTVHQIWAARVKPDHPLPLLASLNQDSQNLNIQTLKLYQLDDKGNFTPADKQIQAEWIPPRKTCP